jgi:hypothetical protein
MLEALRRRAEAAPAWRSSWRRIEDVAQTLVLQHYQCSLALPPLATCLAEVEVEVDVAPTHAQTSPPLLLSGSLHVVG